MSKETKNNMTKKQLPTADERKWLKSEKKWRHVQETTNKDSTAQTHIGRAANTLKAQGNVQH